MVSPDVARALPALERDGVLSPAQAALLGRIARGERASADLLLHALLYAGVLAVTGGVGLLVKDRITDLGPVAIAALIGAAAAGCLGWCARVAPPFARGRTAAPGVAFDYLLVLGALLLAADLAWIEWRFTPLGAAWPWHLLVVSGIHAALALRFDSRALFALALAGFAAWRGVAVASLEQTLFGWAGGTLALRLNGLACGVLFIAAGHLLRRRDVKAHFEPVATLLGWVLALVAVAGGMDGDAPAAWLHRVALLALGAWLGVRHWRTGDFRLFVLGVLAGYVAFLALTLPGIDGGGLSALYVAASAAALLAGLLRARARRRGDSP